MTLSIYASLSLSITVCQEFRRAQELQGQHGAVTGILTIDADVLLLQSPRLLMDPLWTLQPTKDTKGATMPIDGVILIPGAWGREWEGRV
jgi:hypothetical protein